MALAGEQIAVGMLWCIRFVKAQTGVRNAGKVIRWLLR